MIAKIVLTLHTTIKDEEQKTHNFERQCEDYKQAEALMRDRERELTETMTAAREQQQRLEQERELAQERYLSFLSL